MIGKHSAVFNTKYDNSETTLKQPAAISLQKSGQPGDTRDSFSEFLSIFAV